MMQFVIAAPRSGSGKTTVTCALLAALKKRGMDPCAFKSGPDYIDPMFHRSVLGWRATIWIFIFLPKIRYGNCTPIMLPGTGLWCAKGPWVFTMGRA